MRRWNGHQHVAGKPMAKTLTHRNTIFQEIFAAAEVGMAVRKAEDKRAESAHRRNQ